MLPIRQLFDTGGMNRDLNGDVVTFAVTLLSQRKRSIAEIATNLDFTGAETEIELTPKALNSMDIILNRTTMYL